jgi:hypothetical protein
MTIYTKEEWLRPNEKGYAPYQLTHEGGSYSPDGVNFYTGKDAAEALRKNHPAYAMRRPKPELKDVVGKYLVTSQFTEPTYYIDNKRHVATWDQIDDDRWFDMDGGLYNERTIRWGHSTWLINNDGTLTFSGANYDSSG